MKPSEHTIMLIGGPQAGKTSFLARLWLDIEAGANGIGLSERPKDEEYLRKISASLLTGEFPPRTPQSESAHCDIPLHTHNGQNAQLIVPDLSGEVWQTLYERREWPANFENLINENCTCLIFLRATEFVELVDWITADYQESSAERGGVESSVPTEIIVVDWLQMLKTAYSRSVGSSHRPRIGLVFSVWDELPTKYQESPLQYLKSDFKMLNQFVENNSDRYSFGLFALSATGGDLQRDAFKKEFVANPTSHGYVRTKSVGVAEKEQDFPISALISWCLSNAQEH